MRQINNSKPYYMCVCVHVCNEEKKYMNKIDEIKLNF